MSGVDIAGLVSEWRKAMEGATPGPWTMEIESEDRVGEAGDDRQPEVYVCSEQTACDYTVVATMGRAERIPHMRKSFDAAWIARCSPSGISALLDTLTAATRQRDEALAALKASEEALRPFAKAGELFARYDGTDALIYGPAAGSDYNLSSADLLRARSVLENSKARLADATNNPPSDPGTEQREAGRG